MKYIKGFKVDRDKVIQRFGSPENDPRNLLFHNIISLFPREAYKCVEIAVEDGNYSLVMVLEVEMIKPSWRTPLCPSSIRWVLKHF
jgi:hypothetical protein